MIVKKIIIVLLKEFNLIKDVEGTRTEIYEIPIIRILGENKGKGFIKTVTANCVNKIISEFFCEEIANEIYRKLDMDNHSKHLQIDTTWIIENTENPLILNLKEKGQIYKVISFDIEGNEIVDSQNGQYVYNEINALSLCETRGMIQITSSKPIYLKNELRVPARKYNRRVKLQEKYYFKFSAHLMWDLLYKIMPSFFEKNICINQSWVSMSDLNNSVYTSVFDLKIMYPVEYIDLNGGKNIISKSIISEGRLCNCIGEGDLIVLNDNLSATYGFFAIEFECKEINTIDKVVYLDEDLSECNVDVINGMFVGHLVGKFQSEDVEKDVCISLKELFNSIICGGNKRAVFDNYVSEAVIQL